MVLFGRLSYRAVKTKHKGVGWVVQVVWACRFGSGLCGGCLVRVERAVGVVRCGAALGWDGSMAGHTAAVGCVAGSTAVLVAVAVLLWRSFALSVSCRVRCLVANAACGPLPCSLFRAPPSHVLRSSPRARMPTIDNGLARDTPWPCACVASLGLVGIGSPLPPGPCITPG